MSKCLINVTNKYFKEAEKAQNNLILDEMIKEIDDIRKKSRTKDGFRRALDQYIKDTGEEKIKNEYYAVIQSSKYAEIDRTIKAAPSRAEGLLSLIRGSNYSYEGAGVNLENLQSARVNKYMHMIETSFSDAEFKALGSRGMDRDLIMYISSGGKKGSPDVKKFADVLSKLGKYLHEDKVKTGIVENFLEGRVFNNRNLYDVNKMTSMGKEAWVDLVHSKLDIERSFPYMEAKADQIKYLGDVFDNILKKSDDFKALDFSKVPKERIKGQLVKKYSKQRQLHYTPEGLADMFEQFSDRSLIESVLSEATRVSKDIASFEIFGPAGSNGFAATVQRTIKGIQKEMKSLEVNSPEWTKLNKELDDIVAMRDGKKSGGLGFNAYFKEFYQSSFDGNNGPSLIENARTLTATSSLGMTTFGAVTDLGFGVAKLNFSTGGGFLKSSSDFVTEAMKNIPPAKQKELALKFAIGLESQMGNILRGESATGAFSKFATKVSYIHHAINPLAQQARWTRSSIANLVSMEFGGWVDKPFKELTSEAQMGLSKAGISEIDFQALKEMRTDVGEGIYSIDTLSMDRISDETAKEVIAKHKQNNPNFIPKTPEQYRAHIEKRLDAFYTEIANDAAPKPGLKEKAVLSLGAEKGTVQREFMDTITMFKSFSIKQMNIMQKVWLSSPTTDAKVKHLSGLAIGLLTTSYIAECLYSLARNETPPDPTSPETMKKVAVRSGLGGIFADALLGRDDWATTFVAGPVVSKAQTIINAGRGEQPEKLTELVPFQNYAPIKMALSYTILNDWKEMSRPGHNKRMEQRRKENEGLLWRQENIVE